MDIYIAKITVPESATNVVWRLVAVRASSEDDAYTKVRASVANARATIKVMGKLDPLEAKAFPNQGPPDGITNITSDYG